MNAEDIRLQISRAFGLLNSEDIIKIEAISWLLLRSILQTIY